MKSSELLLTQLDRTTASESELLALNAFENVIHSEVWSDAATIPLEQTIARLRSSPPYFQHDLWAIRRTDGGEILAIANALHFERDRHLMYFDVSVLPEMRCKGVARRLLCPVAETAGRENRQLLQARTFSTVPAGEAFMGHLDARLGRTRHINQLEIARLDLDQLRAWHGAFRSNQSFEIGMWKGPYPEEDLVSMCALHQASSNPFEEETLKREDTKVTPDRLRQHEDSLQEDKVNRWTLYVRERETRSLVGYTEVLWSPFEPETLDQGMTCVLPEYRNHGLGRWIKAAMLLELVRERPAVRQVRTGNATTNAPMLKINHELGFRPRMTRKDWQVDLEQLSNYLEGRPASTASV